jgi:hypothetical protein
MLRVNDPVSPASMLVEVAPFTDNPKSNAAAVLEVDVVVVAVPALTVRLIGAVFVAPPPAAVIVSA